MTHETPYGKATVRWTTIRGWTIYLGRTKIIGRELTSVPTTEQVNDEVAAYMNAMKKYYELKNARAGGGNPSAATQAGAVAGR